MFANALLFHSYFEWDVASSYTNYKRVLAGKLYRSIDATRLTKISDSFQ